METESEMDPEPIQTPRALSLLASDDSGYTVLHTISQEWLRRSRAPQFLRTASLATAALLFLTALASGVFAGPRLMGSWSGRDSSQFLKQSWQLDCADDDDNCWTSRCCKDASKTCFARGEGWAQCSSQCSRDAQGVGEDPWKCAVLRPKAQCSAQYKNCTSSHCCSDLRQRCYYKDAGWASCKNSCLPNSIDSSEAPRLQTRWSCVLAGSNQRVPTAEEMLSTTRWSGLPRLPMTPLVPALPSLPKLGAGGATAPQQQMSVGSGNCSRIYKNCKETQCCMQAGVGCHKRDDDWYECREDCPHDKRWACAKLLEILQPSKASGSSCAATGENCRETQCCKDAGARCFTRDTTWSECRTSCPGGNSGWDCTPPALSAPSSPTAAPLVPMPAVPVPTPAPPGSGPDSGVPQITLYCFSLMLPHGDEEALMKTQLTQSVGVFSCDGYTVLSNETIELAQPPTPIQTVAMPGSLKCGFGGEYNTALNSQIFVRVWNKIIHLRRFLQFDWTVKLDPDCVFLPWRLQNHVRSRNPGDMMYLNNCDEGLHGPVEVLSQGGMKAFALGFERCKETLAPEVNDYGEDVWLRRCMGLLGVARKDDYRLLTEKACKPYKDPIPCHSGAVAFHPLKIPSLYFKCLTQATSDDKALG